jgi:hypothetical protein
MRLFIRQRLRVEIKLVSRRRRLWLDYLGSVVLGSLEAVPIQHAAPVPKAIVAAWDCDTLAAWFADHSPHSGAKGIHGVAPKGTHVADVYRSCVGDPE